MMYDVKFMMYDLCTPSKSWDNNNWKLVIGFDKSPKTRTNQP